MAVQCVLPQALYRAKEYPNGFTLHHKMVAAGAVCAFVTVVLCLFMFQRHVRHSVCPEQQKHLARIAILPAIFAIFQLFGLIFYDASKYLESIPRVYEAIALCSLFELYVAYVSSGVPNDAAARFRHVRQTGRYGQKKSGALLLRLNFIFIYQLPFITLGCLIASEVVAATQCELSTAYRSSQKAIRLVNAISTIVALAQLIIFHISMRQELRGTKALRKLLGIKILVILVVAVTVVFGFVKPGMTQQFVYASYFDVVVGVPNLLLCTLMLLFAVAWLFLFGLSSVKSDSRGERLFPGKALLQIINISDLFSNTWVALTTKVGAKDNDDPSRSTSYNHVVNGNDKMQN